ncbi:MAG: hypothetical protein H6817_05395 [Phycisphaerales bacterium]|nr:hypothetical protein [Phycisphaerales bacterium]
MSSIVNRRIVFLGGKPLSAHCLRALHRHHAAQEIDIVGVVCRPKRQTGWWSGPGVPEMRETAEELGLPILESDDALRDLDFDLGITVRHNRILRSEHLSAARHGFINLHCAPLPHYRGCNGCAHAIINGETRFGATLHHVDDKVNHGDVIRVEWCPITAEMTARTLLAAVERTALRMFRELLPAIIANRLPGTPQHELVGSGSIVSHYYPQTSLAKPDIQHIDPAWPVERILRHVRGLDFPPFEPAYMVLNGCKVHLTTDLMQHRLPPTSPRETAP